MESHTRTVLKTLSWRVIAAFVTGTLTYLATGSLEAGVALGSADTLVKLLLYYAHERIWTRLAVGYRPAEAAQPGSSSLGPGRAARA